MDLMSLLAKLTLDKTEYDKGLEDAEKSANDLSIATPKLPKVDNTDFKAGLDEAEQTGNIFKEVMSGVWEGVKDAIVTTGILATVSGIISSMREGISLAAKNGDAISKGAKNLQLSTRAYQEYEYALGKSNIQVKDLQKAMTTFDTIRGGNITEKQAKYFEELGINAEQASSGMMSAEQMLTSVMNSLADYTGADKGAIIDAFFGKSDKWTGYFDQTSDEIQGLKKEAESLGLIMSDESVQNAAEFADATERLGDRLEAIKRSFGEGILPVITEAVNKLMMIIDFFSGTDQRTSTEKFADVDSIYNSKIKDIEANQITAKTMSKFLLGMGDTSGMDSTQLAIWKGRAESLIKLIPTLSGVIDTENGTINESAEGISKLIDEYTELEKETAYQTAKAEKQAVLDQKRAKLTEEAVATTDKLSEAESQRIKAIDDYNAVLKRYDMQPIGYDATVQDIQDAQLKTLLSLSGDEWGTAEAAKALQGAAKPLTDLLNSAQSSQAEVEKLTADIAEGQAALDAWTSSQGETYGAISGTAQAAQGDVAAVTDALNGIPGDVYSTIHITTDGDGYPHAKGAWNIPMDNYPALLHRGEMVLSASQARRYRDGESGGTDNALIVELIGEVRELRRRNIYMDGDKVADLTTERTKNNMNAQSRSRTRAYGGT